MSLPPPEVLALVLADHVHQDDATDKLFILGTRTAIRAPSFPWNHPVLSVHAVLVDGRGEVSLRFRLVDADEDREVIAEEVVLVTFPDPVTEVEVVVFLDDLLFPEQGEYRLQLFSGEQFLRERRLVVVPLENQEQP